MAARPNLGQLLDLNRSPTSKKAIAATNATTSPFLKLPPELRTRIYNYALEENTYHVYYDGTQAHAFSLWACTKPHDYDIASPPLKVRRSNKKSHMDPHDHSKCQLGKDSKKGFSLALLSICRQIYHETVLLPFTTNTFVVGEHSYLWDEFPGKFVPAQVEAIKHVVYIHDWSRPSGWTHASWFKQLSGLQTLHYVVTGAHFNEDTVEQLERGFEESRLDILDAKDLKRFHVEVRQRYVASRQLAIIRPVQAFEQHAEAVAECVKRLESKIMLKGAEVDDNG